MKLTNTQRLAIWDVRTSESPENAKDRIHDMTPETWRAFRAWCLKNDFGDPIREDETPCRVLPME